MTTTPHMLQNSQQCPYCRQWVRLPLRRARAAFDAHKLRCRASVPEPRTDYPTFCSACHEPRNSAELNHAGTCTDCVGRFWREPTDCPRCGHHVSYHQSGCLDCDCTWSATATEPAKPETVKRATLWDGVQDSHQTEAELNGFRATQGALL